MPHSHGATHMKRIIFHKASIMTHRNPGEGKAMVLTECLLIVYHMTILLHARYSSICLLYPATLLLKTLHNYIIKYLPEDGSLTSCGHTTSPSIPLEGAKFLRGSSALRRHSIAHPFTEGLMLDSFGSCKGDI